MWFEIEMLGRSTEDLKSREELEEITEPEEFAEEVCQLLFSYFDGNIDDERNGWTDFLDPKVRSIMIDAMMKIYPLVRDERKNAPPTE